MREDIDALENSKKELTAFLVMKMSERGKLYKFYQTISFDVNACTNPEGYQNVLMHWYSELNKVDTELYQLLKGNTDELESIKDQLSKHYQAIIDQNIHDDSQALLDDQVERGDASETRIVWSDKEQVIQAIQSNSGNLKYAAPSLKKDAEVVLAAVRQNGLALRFADFDYSKGSELPNRVVFVAMQQDVDALQYAPAQLLADKGFMINAIESNPEAFKYGSRALRNDKVFVARIMQINTGIFKYASDELKQDLDLVKLAKKFGGTDALSFAKHDVTSNHVLLVAAGTGLNVDNRGQLVITEALRRAGYADENGALTARCHFAEANRTLIPLEGVASGKRTPGNFVKNWITRKLAHVYGWGSIYNRDKALKRLQSRLKTLKDHADEDEENSVKLIVTAVGYSRGAKIIELVKEAIQNDKQYADLKKHVKFRTAAVAPTRAPLGMDRLSGSKQRMYAFEQAYVQMVSKDNRREPTYNQDALIGPDFGCNTSRGQYAKGYLTRGSHLAQGYENRKDSSQATQAKFNAAIVGTFMQSSLDQESFNDRQAESLFQAIEQRKEFSGIVQDCITLCKSASEQSDIGAFQSALAAVESKGLDDVDTVKALLATVHLAHDAFDRQADADLELAEDVALNLDVHMSRTVGAQVPQDRQNHLTVINELYQFARAYRGLKPLSSRMKNELGYVDKRNLVKRTRRYWLASKEENRALALMWDINKHLYDNLRVEQRHGHKDNRWLQLKLQELSHLAGRLSTTGRRSKHNQWSLLAENIGNQVNVKADVRQRLRRFNQKHPGFIDNVEQQEREGIRFHLPVNHSARSGKKHRPKPS